MRIVNVHHAWSLPPRTRGVVLVLLSAVVVAVAVASFMGHGTAAVAVVATALLTVAVEELMRTAIRYWLRTV